MGLGARGLGLGAWGWGLGLGAGGWRLAAYDSPTAADDGHASDALKIATSPNQGKMFGLIDHGCDALELAKPDLHQKGAVVIEHGTRLTHDLANLSKTVVSSKERQLGFVPRHFGRQ